MLEKRRKSKLTNSYEDLGKRRDPNRALKRQYRKYRSLGFIEALQSVLSPDDIVVDCGANIGEITGVLAETGAQIHAFEPEGFAFGKLSERCKDLPNVTLYNAAVGVEQGTLTLYKKKFFDKNPLAYSLTTTSLRPKEEEVQDYDVIETDVIDLPAFLAEQTQLGRVAFLKLDIEGAELEILENLVSGDLLTKIRATAAEIHPWLWPKKDRPRFKALRQIATEHPEYHLNLDWF